MTRRASRSTRAEVAAAEAAQQAVASALLRLGRGDLAARLLDCLDARRGRRGGDGRTWPRQCRSAGCRWCVRTRQHAMWGAALEWSSGVRRSLAVIPARHRPGGIRDAVRRVRRGLRDVRDRLARRRRGWRGVSIAGVAVGDAVWVVVLHPGVDQVEVRDVLRRRWPSAVVRDVDGAEILPFHFDVADSVALALARRGGSEPMRVVVGLRLGGRVPLPHRARDVVEPIIEPMPMTS